MKKFLTNSSEIFNLKSTFTHFYKKIEYIQTNLRIHLRAFKNRCEALGELWERERRLVIELWRMEEEKQFFFEERQEQEDTDGESKDQKLGDLEEEEILEDENKWKNRMELAKGKEGVGLQEKDLTELETDRDERMKMRQGEIDKMKEEEEGATKLMEERRQVFDAEEEREKLLKFI